MPPEPALALATPVLAPPPAPAPASARNTAPRDRLRIVDVAIFYGERGGGIHTYLEAKAEFARRTGWFEHHLVVPGWPDAASGAGRHEQPSLRLATSNGYRLPLGTGECRPPSGRWPRTWCCSTTLTGRRGSPVAPLMPSAPW